jgi:hypothetical protein
MEMDEKSKGLCMWSIIGDLLKGKEPDFDAYSINIAELPGLIKEMQDLKGYIRGVIFMKDENGNEKLFINTTEVTAMGGLFYKNYLENLSEY